jgi:hypothetical protein
LEFHKKQRKDYLFATNYELEEKEAKPLATKSPCSTPDGDSERINDRYASSLNLLRGAQLLSETMSG